MGHLIRSTLVLGLAAFALAGPALAAKRVALVIGNDDYANLAPLEKAANDARAVAATLEEIGFEVFLGENLTRRETNRRLADFEAAIAPGDTAFFFFAGHGVAIGGENYLIPGDMPNPGAGEEGLVRDEAHAVSELVARVRGRGAASSFFVLDACRDNPFAAAGVGSIGGTRGLPGSTRRPASSCCTRPAWARPRSTGCLGATRTRTRCSPDVTPVSHPAGTGIRRSSNARHGRPSRSSFLAQRSAYWDGVCQPSRECGRVVL